MGSSDPTSFSRGKRGVAGSLIFTVFDRSALYDIMQGARYVRKTTDIYAGGFTGDPNGGAPGVNEEIEFGGIATKPNYADQIPPFDCTLTAANELGQGMWMRIIGIDILNEGMGMSIDDITIEAQYTFIARSIIGWTPVLTDRTSLIGGTKWGQKVGNAGDLDAVLLPGNQALAGEGR